MFQAIFYAVSHFTTETKAFLNFKEQNIASFVSAVEVEIPDADKSFVHVCLISVQFNMVANNHKIRCLREYNLIY